MGVEISRANLDASGVAPGVAGVCVVQPDDLPEALREEDRPAVREDEVVARVALAADDDLLAELLRLPDDLDDLVDSGALARPTMWWFGSEAHGLPADVLSDADHAVRVPIYGRAESLNLAAAAAVCLYASAHAQRPSRPG